MTLETLSQWVKEGTEPIKSPDRSCIDWSNDIMMIVGSSDIFDPKKMSNLLNDIAHEVTTFEYFIHNSLQDGIPNNLIVSSASQLEVSFNKNIWTKYRFLFIEIKEIVLEKGLSFEIMRRYIDFLDLRMQLGCFNINNGVYIAFCQLIGEMRKYN